MNAVTMTVAMLVLVAAAVCLFYFVKMQDKREAQQHAPGSAAAAAGGPVPEKGATAAFVRRLKTACWKRGLALVEPDPAKSPFCALIVSPCGVTGVYAADAMGTVYGSAEAQWSQIYKGQRRTFRSPLLEAEDARKALREEIAAGKFRPFTVDAKVVFVSAKAELALPKSLPCTQPKEFLHYVEYEEPLMTDRKVDEAALKAFLGQQLAAAAPAQG